MRRLLYVQGGGVAGIRKDGESLVVQVDGQADRRYPFRMLARVVMRGDTRIHAAAIWGLLAAGVPITLQSSSGEPCGFALPYRSPRRGPTEWAECVLENPDGRGRWQSWVRARERAEIRRVYAQQRWTLGDWRTGAIEQDLRRRSDATVLRATAERRAALAAEAATVFNDEGLAPSYVARLEKEMCLQTDLARILTWRPWVAAITRASGTADARGQWEDDREAEAARVRRWVSQVLQWMEGGAWHDRNDRHGW